MSGPAGLGPAGPAGVEPTGPAGAASADREQVIGAYLAEVASRLIGPAGVRRDILAELGAGLADASNAYRSAGLAAGEAARAAITEFGRPQQVADGFRAELTAAQARRTALILLRTGPPIGLLWTGAALASHIGARLASPWHWASMPAGAPLITRLAGIALATAISSAVFTLAATGRLTRWLPVGPLRLPVRPRWLPAYPAASAAMAACGTAAIDVTLLALLTTQVISAPGRLAALPVAVAAVGSLSRLMLTTRAARNCLITGVASSPAGA